MKSPFRKIYIVVLVVICQTAFSQKIGLLLDDFISDRWYLDKKHFTERVTELGGEVLFEVAYADTGAQVSLAKKMLDAGVKVLVVVPTDARQARKIAELAAQKNVPLISYDRLILSNKVSLYISYDNQKVGRLQAQYALKQKPEGKFIQINGPVSDNNAILFKAGQDEALAKPVRQGKVQVLGSFVMEDWGELGAWMKLEEFLSKGGLVPDAVLTANDALAAGVIRALPKDLQGKVIVTGQDADISGLRNIFAGTQSMTVYKPIAPLAKKAAEMAIDLANGKDISGTTNFQMGALSVKAIFLDPVVVDKSNYKETVVKDGHAAQEEIEN
jgi:D-xylose transport system substrate-binding protein